MTKPEPLLVLRPVFDETIAKTCATVLGIGATILLSLVGGVFLFILLSAMGLGVLISPGYLFGLLLVSGVIILPALYYESKKKAYAGTVFKFYDRHVDYQFFQHHITRRRGRIFYADIEDVMQRANFIQEQKHLTTLLLYVPSMRVRGNVLPGVKIPDITQTQDYFGMVTDIVDRGRSMPAPAMAAPAQQAAG